VCAAQLVGNLASAAARCRGTALAVLWSAASAEQQVFLLPVRDWSHLPHVLLL
jgi:hypothetical protein